MKNNRFNSFLAMMLTFVMTSMLFTPALAAAKFEGTDKKPVAKKNLSGVKATILANIKADDGQTTFSPEELEQMRSAMYELLDANLEVANILSPKGRERMNGLGLQKGDNPTADLRKQIEQMSDKQLTTLRKVLNPAKMQSKLQQSRLTLSQYKNSVMKTAAGSVSINSAGLPDINAYCSPLSPEAIIAADVIFFAAELVRDEAQDACNETIVVLGEGGNGSLACLITDAIYVAAHAANQAIHFCDDDYAQSVGQASFERLGHIHADLESSVANDNANTASIISNDNTNKTAIINNDNTNKDTIVANDDAHFVSLTNLINATRTAIINNANDNKDEVKNLLLRTQIEADLASTDGSAFVALYETPSNVCLPALNDKGMPQLAASLNAPTPTQCGLLDLVRSIVRDTIANVGAGTNAQKFFTSAEAQRAAGKYKDAYASYRQAYKAAGK